MTDGGMTRRDRPQAPDPDTAGEGTARGRRRSVPGWLFPVLTTLGVLLLWELAGSVLKVPAHILPRPSEIVGELIAEQESLTRHSIVTTLESLGGIALSIAAGVPLAVGLAYLPAFERSIYPLLVTTQAVPKVAIAPLFTVWFGFGAESKLLMAFLIAFFPILIDTTIGLKSVKTDHVNLARTMGASGWQIFRRIRMPSAYPHFFAGLKVAVTLSVIGAIVGEFMGASVGLGYLLLVAIGFVDTKLLFAIIVLLATLGIVLFYAVVVIERLVIPWHQSQRLDDRAGG